MILLLVSSWGEFFFKAKLAPTGICAPSQCWVQLSWSLCTE
jgi:hypothetical protein